MATLKSSALIVRSMNWRDSSRIIALLTRNNGRLDVIAKGVNRQSSPFTGILEPLNLVEVVIHFSEKRELQILGKAELESNFTGIRQDLEKTGFALAILEILNVFFKDHNPVTDFYDFVIYLLNELEKGVTAKIIFWYFMLKLTSYLGFKPEFTVCYICGNKITNEHTHFLFESGSVVCANCKSSEGSALRIPMGICSYLGALQSTNYKKLALLKDPEFSDTEITKFLQNYLRYHTNEKLDLKALDYFRIDEIKQIQKVERGE